MGISAEVHREQGMLGLFWVPDNPAQTSEHPLGSVSSYCKQGQVQTGRSWPHHQSLHSLSRVQLHPFLSKLMALDISSSTSLPVPLDFQNLHTSVTASFPAPI